MEKCSYLISTKADDECLYSPLWSILCPAIIFAISSAALVSVLQISYDLPFFENHQNVILVAWI